MTLRHTVVYCWHLSSSAPKFKVETVSGRHTGTRLLSRRDPEKEKDETCYPTV